MKVSAQEASKKVGIHPAFLLMCLSELSPSLTFEELWPEIDEAWIETVSASRGEYIPHSGPRLGGQKRTKEEKKPSALSESSRRIIDKLKRHKHWGRSTLPIEALGKITRLSSKEIQMGIEELREKGYLDHDGGSRGVVSLSPSKKHEIESIEL